MKVYKRAITLLEIMIVIVIIGIIGSVVSYSMKGSLDQGRAFKSEEGSRQVHALLTLQMAQGYSAKQIKEDPADVLLSSGLSTNTKKLLKDGWGKDFEIKFLENGDFIVTSNTWKTFLSTKKRLSEQQMQEEYPWAFSDKLCDEELSL